MQTRIRLLILLAVVCPVIAMAIESNRHAGSMTENMMFVVMQLGVILFAAKAGNLLFSRFNLPGVLGELLSGVLIGPFALGAIRLPGFEQGLFPLPMDGGAVTPELYAFGAVAAIILLFDVGLETDLKLLIRYSAAGSLVGAGGVIFSFVVGAGITAGLSEPLFGTAFPFFHPVSLFMGVVSTATSVGITARILSEKKKLDSPEGVTILSAAVVDDVIGIILLAVVLGMVASSTTGGDVDWGGVGVIGLKALGVWLISTLIGIAASSRISLFLKTLHDPTAMAILALGLALLLAGIFEQAGLAMIIGAYVTGLSLSKTDISHLVREKLHPIYAFLVPVFFCITGMMINLGTLVSKPVLLFGLVFTLGAFLSKLLGCGLPSMLAKFNVRGAARIGVGMVPRGEVGLIVAGIGTNVALMPNGSPLPEELFASVVLMVMASTLLAPPLLSFLFQNPARGTRLEPSIETDRLSIEFNLPSEQMAEFFVQKMLAEFESEGFFWHRLDRDAQLYQLRKDETIIDFQREETSLAFHGSASDLVLVRGILLEAGASLEDTLRGLRQPFNAKALGHEFLFNPDSKGTYARFKLENVLSPNHILPELKGRTKPEVIDELLGVLVAHGDLQDITEGRAAIWEREEKMSTALEEGVAIPHGKTDAVSKLVCAMGIYRDGMHADALDGKPSRFFVLTLSPKSRPAPHVQFMAAISQALNADGRDYLSRQHTADEIMAYLISA
ncbi:MAG: cation:proton antiporter [Kiritimatiellae bacterium]|jgi:Kef-type K+ transport system membrane component KefB/mannitol/fructose-specific phosphotransferase system IIA component (Ntr-type)|nr:cation:proton antiporter [Kiritimatiellia bacterium]